MHKTLSMMLLRTPSRALFLTRELKRVHESMFAESFIISFLKYQGIYFAYVISREPVA